VLITKCYFISSLAQLFLRRLFLQEPGRLLALLRLGLQARVLQARA